MILSEAAKIALTVKALLAPHCDRIEIAGSVRRRKPIVGDIEIVAIPKRAPAFDLIDTGRTVVSPAFCAIVNGWPAVKGVPEGRYTQRVLPEINLDLFMAHPKNWGLIFAIRTGSADYSHNVLAKGWVRAGFKSVDGMLCKTGPEWQPDGIGPPVEVREEIDLFNLAGVPWQKPERR